MDLLNAHSPPLSAHSTAHICYVFKWVQGPYFIGGVEENRKSKKIFLYVFYEKYQVKYMVLSFLRNSPTTS